MHRASAGSHGHLDQCWAGRVSLRPIYLIGGQLCPQAYDDDQPGTNNSLLLFSLLPGPYSSNFSLDPNTGLLRNLGPLDREAIDPALEGRIVLTVIVADCGEPSLNTSVNVTITVEVRLGTPTQPSSRVLAQALPPALDSTGYKRLGSQLRSLWRSLSLS